MTRGKPITVLKPISNDQGGVCRENRFSLSLTDQHFTSRIETTNMHQLQQRTQFLDAVVSLKFAR
jgi:hypothetical protein